MPVLKEDYIDTGKVKYVVRDFPLSIHEHANMAAQATHCAADQGAADQGAADQGDGLFWEMRQAIFEHHDSVSKENLLTWAEEIGIDPGQMRECLESEKYATRVYRDVLDGNRAGVESTPSFFFGFTNPLNPSGKVLILEKIEGAESYSAFRHRLEFMLSEHQRITSEQK